ncbi:hypothetical protein Nmel_001180 [Mimus melanotis]
MRESQERRGTERVKSREESCSQAHHAVLAAEILVSRRCQLLTLDIC